MRALEVAAQASAAELGEATRRKLAAERGVLAMRTRAEAAEARIADVAAANQRVDAAATELQAMRTRAEGAEARVAALEAGALTLPVRRNALGLGREVAASLRAVAGSVVHLQALVSRDGLAERYGDESLREVRETDGHMDDVASAGGAGGVDGG